MPWPFWAAEAPGCAEVGTAPASAIVRDDEGDRVESSQVEQARGIEQRWARRTAASVAMGGER